MKRYLLVLLLIFSSTILSAQMFRNVSVEAELRKVNNSRIQNLRLTSYFDASGKMVAIYERPENLVIINDERGKVVIYDSQNNTVVQANNPYYSTRTNELYYFINNKKSDLGLSEIGFRMQESEIEGGLIVTEWVPPVDGMKYFSFIKMVHDNDNPIYLEYRDQNNQIVKKVFYYDYEYFNRLHLPTSVTTIDFKNENDSTVSKTIYSDIQFDTKENEEQLKYKVPSDAKVIN
jgi:outer membrane lipoprotein-sorting protein